jgi:predicted transposase YdaD
MPHILSWERIAKKEGKMVGKKEGKQKEKRDTALRMLSDGLPVEAISKYTGLTGQQVKALVQ